MLYILILCYNLLYNILSVTIWQKLQKHSKKGTAMAQTNCESCMNYEYDEDYDCYICTKDLDEDEMIRFIRGEFKDCPFYRFGDEYQIVKKQI